MITNEPRLNGKVSLDDFYGQIDGAPEDKPVSDEVLGIERREATISIEPQEGFVGWWWAW